jgi:SecD/SecF fusion protein
MTAVPFNVVLLVLLVAVVAVLIGARRFLKPFFWRIVYVLTPLAVAGWAVAHAGYRYERGEGGFKLGVDLVGGTILVYEVDPDKKLPENYQPEQLAAALKRRIDPTDLYNVTIRPVSNTRVEIILPTGGEHQAQIEERAWQDLLAKAQEEWPPPEGKTLDVPRGQIADLISRIKDQHPDADLKEVDSFLNENYKQGSERKDVTGEQVQNIKDLISQVGSLEFRILANNRDDPDAIKAAQAYIDEPKNKAELEQLALAGRPPPPPNPPDDKLFVTPKGTRTFTTKLEGETHHFTYSWVELGRSERHTLGLDNAARDDEKRKAVWEQASKNRNKAVLWDNQTLLYSRDCQEVKLPPDKRKEKAVEYFLLVRDPEEDLQTGEVKAITGRDLTRATAGQDEKLKPAVHFGFNTHGGQLFYDVTSQNRPTGSEGSQFYRQLAIILDGQIMSAPNLHSAIRTDGQITGNFTQKEVERLVNILRAGALPATLKPQPVSENTMGATLGEYTIHRGAWSVVWAFAAILVFMIVYYRFAGLVASVALLANLLLTVGFMVAVSATFTLPGLAGLVLMLGMAVDANVLIYERLREERDRGASLPLAIRNGYDRAFPTIIDTHLTSIFTGIVLYAVGNDQLKGFGVSLTVGLVISLFTSLYMTRLLFDIWMAKNWLHKLSMFRLLSRPNIDFMSIRYYWFTLTIALTIFGISVFVARLPGDLNIDFNGGTAYGGQLVQAIDPGGLRDLLNEKSQKEYLQVAEVKEVPGEKGLAYDITYKDPSGTETKRTIHFPNRPLDVKEENLEATLQDRLKDVKVRAEQLPDFSVEQIFPTSETEAGKGSRYFTVRTSEKAPELVQAVIGRLLGHRRLPDGTQIQLKRIALDTYTINPDNKGAVLSFKNPAASEADAAGQDAARKKGEDYASPAQVTMLLERGLKKELGTAPQFSLLGEGDNVEGRYRTMKLALAEPLPRAKLEEVLKDTQREFAERPQPDRLENFDSQLAAETQTRAMYAILASWAAILLYLWFRFGSWTFGLAAVLCLIHDLFFTMGIIAFCHFIHLWMPGVASALLLQDFKIDLPAVAALLTLVGYSVNDTIVVFDRIREVRGKNPELTAQMINDSVNQTLSRTLLTSFATWLVVIVLYVFGGEGVHLFAFVMVVGVIVGTYSSIYIASPLLLIFGEGKKGAGARPRQPQPVGAMA